MKDQGYDVEMRSVRGWSTLGWFNDPILSNMLASGPGELANTIIHELTHSTIFIPDSMTFNENLATFIGTRGAHDFLEFQYGLKSEEYVEYETRKSDSRLFTRYIVQAAKQLDSLYVTIEAEEDAVKEETKTAFIDSIIENSDTIKLINHKRYQDYFINYRPNNAYFISFLNYRERQHEFERIMADSLDNKLSSFIEQWKLSYAK